MSCTFRRIWLRDTARNINSSDRTETTSNHSNVGHSQQTARIVMSVYFRHSGYANHQVERAYRAIEKHTKSKKSIQIVGGDFNAELGLGLVLNESVLDHTPSLQERKLDEAVADAAELRGAQHNVQKDA